MTGVPGSVLVGGRTGGVPQIFGILPDPPQTVVSVFGPSSQWTNIADMEFDGTGRLLFGDENGTSGRVLATSSPGETPAQLFAIAGRIAGLEVDAADRIYTSTFDGKVRLHGADGSVISDPFLSGLGNRILPIAVGPGGPWGTDLYTVNQQTGELIRAATAGNPIVVGTGFSGFLIDFEFGPDGALYVSDLGLGTIWRIAPEATTAVLPLPGSFEPAVSSRLRIEHQNPAWLPLAIRYELPATSRAQVRIYDIQGRWVRTLVDGETPAGAHAVEWDGRDDGGRVLPAGTYFFRLDANLATRTSKVLILH
jgi:sugar lactone lactonase YvrE